MIFLMLIVTMTGNAQDSGLKKGDIVPSFEAVSDNGEIYKSKDVIGKKNLVVYFYPAAMTGGCTAQACAYRYSKDDLENVDAEVIGVSGDEADGLALFKKAENLNFTLLSDPEGKIAKIFGVPVRDGGSIEREVDGKTYTLKRGITTARWTFIIDKSGKLVYKSTEVNAGEDSKNVLAVLEGLN